MLRNLARNKWASRGQILQTIELNQSACGARLNFGLIHALNCSLAYKKLGHARGHQFAVIVIILSTIGTLPPPIAGLPWMITQQVPGQQTSSQVAYLDAGSLAIGPGGCVVTYYDESMAPIAPLAAGAANYSVLANGPPFASAPLQMSAQQQQLANSSSNGQQPASIGLECQYITGEQLHDNFNRIKPTGLRVTSLVVKDSNLTTLGNMPQGVHELRKLIISNTSIDLEVLKEGSESLDKLTTLDITNEKISNIPHAFFQEMSSLKELRLENDEIASLDSDAFHNLDDSLEVLDLKRNRFNRFPMAVKNLAQLAVLDLSDNEIVIDFQENDLPEKLEPLLNLHELAMNRINCTCEFSSSPFYEWIVRTHISGVRCCAPEKLKYQEVIVFERDDFCPKASASSNYNSLNYHLFITFIAPSILALELARQNVLNLG